MLNMEKTVQMRDFNPSVVSLPWVKLCKGISLRNIWRAERQSCS